MPQERIQQRASRITRFLVVQLIALVGWIIVQSFFSLSPIGQAVPFTVTIIIEAIWWIITLVIMFLLFRREYQSFVQAAVDLEDANKRLREATNRVLHELKSQNDQADHEPTTQSDQAEPELQSNPIEHEPTIQNDQSEPELQSNPIEHEPTAQNEAEHDPTIQGDQPEHVPEKQGDQAVQDAKPE